MMASAPSWPPRRIDPSSRIGYRISSMVYPPSSIVDLDPCRIALESSERWLAALLRRGTPNTLIVGPLAPPLPRRKKGLAVQSSVHVYQG
jgi:hypothetical protein